MEVQKEDIWHEILEFAVFCGVDGDCLRYRDCRGISAFKDLVSLRTTIIEALVIVSLLCFSRIGTQGRGPKIRVPAVYRVWIPGLILAMGAMFGWTLSNLFMTHTNRQILKKH